MNSLPEEIRKAWDDRNGAIVFATVDGNQCPNAIYATCAGIYQNGKIVIADNYFDKTRKNILTNSRGAVLFMTKDNKAYQIKGSLEYQTKGEIFDFMKTWNPSKHPGHAAAILTPDEIYSGAKKLY